MVESAPGDACCVVCVQEEGNKATAKSKETLWRPCAIRVMAWSLSSSR